MSVHSPAKEIHERLRREVFRALVEAQDGGSSVLQSRADVARHFRIPPREVRRIEGEGIDNDWPPL
jgi:hypothetical protein